MRAETCTCRYVSGNQKQQQEKGRASRMKFSEMMDQASEFPRQPERVAYQALKREFNLDEIITKQDRKEMQYETAQLSDA
jgi:hypothetical protein